MHAQKALRARDRKYSVLTHAPFGFISFLLLLKCRQLKKKLSPAFMHARTILLIQIKKSLATDAIYCCSLFKHLTLFAGRTRKRNLCQREQFESKSLRAQYVSHLFIQAARQGSPHSADFSHTEPCYTANFVFGAVVDARPNLFYSSSILSSICRRCRRFLFFAPQSRSQFSTSPAASQQKTPCREHKRDLDTRLSILMIHISLFLIRVHFNLLLNYLPPNITTITCSCDARFCSPRAAFAYKYSGALQQHQRNDVI
jgi:hypothetical protein